MLEHAAFKPQNIISHKYPLNDFLLYKTAYKGFAQQTAEGFQSLLTWTRRFNGNRDIIEISECESGIKASRDIQNKGEKLLRAFSVMSIHLTNLQLIKKDLCKYTKNSC